MVFFNQRETILRAQQNIFACVFNNFCNDYRINIRNGGSSFVFLFLLSWSIFPFSVQAEEDQWRLCASPTKTTSVKKVMPEKSNTSASKEMKFTADKFEVQGSLYILKGQVKGGRINQQLSADALNYDKNTDIAHATGSVRYEHGDRILTGDNANIDLGKESGNITSARFWLTDKHIRGQADSVKFEGVSETQLQNVTYTTCDEGSDDWVLRASSLHLNTEKNEGIARHARIKLMGVPIFYFPYLSFPLEGRKSGFLAPAFGDSSNSGAELSVPYYWNIAPDRDATLTPKYLSRRGLLMETEFRFLNERSRGQLEVAHINDDHIFGENRTAVSLQHQADPSPGWRTQVEYRHVSDEDYLSDFGSELATTSVTHLERHANVDYRNDFLQAKLLVQGYQTLDQSIPGTDKPYQLLPQLQIFSRNWRGPAGIELGLGAEAVRFDRSEGVVGSRVDVQPRLGWPWKGSSGFVIPKLTLRHTQYQLSRSAPGFDDNPSRSLPIFSLDSGLFFERELAGGSMAGRQTLEPRLFFLHVPYRNQDNLIVDELGVDRVFDTSIPLFSFSQMFRDNRFSGGDRVGDASQLSAALTSRVMDNRGRELLSASVGRTFYFQDREVTLPGGIAETDSTSDWVAEIKSHWTKSLSAEASLQWDSENGNMERGSANILYLKDKRRVLRLSYRFEENSIEQSDMAFIWPMTSHWSLVGRWLHSIRDDVTLETLKGIEYDSCCWTARLVQRSYRVDAMEEDENNTIWFQLELKGLTSVGKGIKNLLARDILSP
jgi:LPS-assembly protein